MIRFIEYSELLVIRRRVIRDATEGRSYSRVFGLSSRADDLGIKDAGVLQSAIDRQTVGYGQTLKYSTPMLNAATLAYGLAKNHAFHDGNKRTALVAMLAHLDKNKLLLPGISHRSLTLVMENIAADRIPVERGLPAAKPKSLRKLKKLGPMLQPPLSLSETVVEDLARFLNKSCRETIRIGYRSMTYRKLRTLLESHGFVLQGPIPGNKMRILRPGAGLVARAVALVRPSRRLVNIGTISWPGDSRSIDLRSLSLIRLQLGLRQEDGYDDAAFYDLEESVDSIVNEYQKVLRALERR